MKKSSVTCITFALIGFILTSSKAYAQESRTEVGLPTGPIVIHNLRIDNIQNLTINTGSAPLTAPATTAAPTIERATSTERPFKTRFLAEDQARDADIAAEDVGLEIHVFALGQADSTLVIGPRDANGDRRSLLIDMGESSNFGKNYETVAEEIDELLGERKLTYFVTTHYHYDHIGGKENGIAGLIKKENVEIDTVIDVGDLGNEFFQSRSNTVKNYRNTMADVVGDGVNNREEPRFGAGQIDLGNGVTVEILAFAGKVHAMDEGVLKKVDTDFPNQYANKPPSENDLSIALKISRGDFEFFTAGDLTGAEDTWGGTRLFTPRFSSTYTNVESWMVNHWNSSGITMHDVEVYRANHHGSGHSTGTEFLDALDPEFVFYSCGGKYDHPSRHVVERVAQTAWQYATTKLAASSWGSEGEFADFKGDVVGDDINIYVDQSGEWYWINDDLHRAFDDDEESSGEDIDEEFNIWVTEVD